MKPIGAGLCLVAAALAALAHSHAAAALVVRSSGRLGAEASAFIPRGGVPALYSVVATSAVLAGLTLLVLVVLEELRARRELAAPAAPGGR